jgi:hypothetical protein
VNRLRFAVLFGSTLGRSPQSYGGGLLHGINPVAPNDANLDPLRPYLWRLGEPGSLSRLSPPNDFFGVFERVASYQPQVVQVVASDFFQEPQYQGVGWEVMCRSLAARATAMGWHPEICSTSPI